MTVAIITPTGGRPEAFSLLQKWMKNQSYGGNIRWLVATNDDEGYEFAGNVVTDGGGRVTQEVIKTDPGTRNALAVNLVAACDRLASDHISGHVFVQEDDDYYHPDYLLLGAMNAGSSGLPIYGEMNARYYNVRTRRARRLPNGEPGKPVRHASLAQTVILSDLLPLLREVAEQHYECRMPAIDMRLWERAPYPRHLVAAMGSHVSVKGMPGKSGYGIGHRDDFGDPDPWLEVFRRWGLPLEYTLYMEPRIRLGWLPAKFDEEAPEVAIGMVARNQGAMTRRAITSVFATTKHLRRQVMLWDNGSTDPEALDLLDELRDLEGVRVFRAEEGAGWIRAVNYMARFSTAPYFIGLNNDIVCHDGWADALIGPIAADASVGCVGFRPAYGMLDARMASHPCPAGREPDYVEGWCFCVPRGVVDRFGPYDEHHLKRFYYDDVDLCLRLKASGLRVACLDEKLVDHFGSSTYHSSPAEAEDMYATHASNRRVVMGRHAGRIS